MGLQLMAYVESPFLHRSVMRASVRHAGNGPVTYIAHMC